MVWEREKRSHWKQHQKVSQYENSQFHFFFRIMSSRQRLSSLEKHLSLEKCTKSLEKRSLLDLAKLGYKSRLEEGTTSQVILSASFRDTREATSGEVEVKEGWALKPSKKAYRFNQNQRDYLNAKFTIGQTSGRKLDGDIVSREMRRARGPDGVRLFKVSEFLTQQQCTSYFSRLAAKVRRQTSDDAEIQASCSRRGKLYHGKRNNPIHQATAPHHLQSVRYLCHGQGRISGAT